MQILPVLIFFVYSVSNGADLPDHLSLPPTWENRTIYYQSFDLDDGSPDINTAGLKLTEAMETDTNGIRGQCAMPGAAKTVGLSGEAISPHRPLAVSFWWALQEDAMKDSGFGLFHLTNGKGFISYFARSGPWCALDRPAGVLQVYYLAGIKNVNGIYDRDFIANAELKAGVWHHTALVFTAGSLVSLYLDGEKVFQIRTTGRLFHESDQLHEMILGNRGELPVVLDEVVILDRPLLDEEIAIYVKAVRQMNQIDYPVKQ
ncbi:LamG-like jellyroll fold domain-containing protein [Candidatus Poribacteria bacterium]